ncbi:hypothetical protein NVP2275O_390 [Vibrio phage 2.275.O._10N.286.54.E11]|nr:hypothetical protein NVP2275O_390 [Vibrio phage 2.275.O._10N.286.54.E11]
MDSAQEIRMMMDELDFLDDSELQDEELAEAKQKTPDSPKDMAPKKTKKGVQDYSRKDGQSHPEKKGFTA